MNISIKTSVVLILFTIFPVISFSQVKIGDNPSLIDSNSVLELESDNKVFVLTRLTDAQINTIVPLEGALVYNTDLQCIFAYDGIEWKNLCDEPNITISNTAPLLDNEIGDFWFNSSNNIANIWNGTEWLPININPRRGSGTPSTSLDNLIAGDIYVDEDNGDLYTFNGTDWVLINEVINADNGLTITGNTIQLGGALIQPTVITTDSTNTLTIQGLPVSTLANNNVVVVNSATGQLQQVEASNIVQQQQIVIIASEGQSQFNTPLSAIDINKIDVFRNGARISFTIIDPNTIEVEPEATCFAGDEIRIVQIN